MRRRADWRLLAPTMLLGMASVATSQTTLPGNELSFRSSGSASGSDWVLEENGYVGTYFTLDSDGEVTISAQASGQADGGADPRMNIVVADSKASFDVASGFTSYGDKFKLPAGTYFVRTEFVNDAPTASRTLTVRDLTITGATDVSNTTTTATNDASALAAADTYVENFRQGPATLALSGLAPGDTVDVKMVRKAFNFGTMVQGFDANVFLAPVAPGDTTSTAARYQQFVKSHFNILVPSNMGKWQPNENTQNVPTMGHVDTILNFTQANGMNARMHNLIWGNQQPAWVNTLITNAQSSNPATAAAAKQSLKNAIVNRIAYYIGDSDGNPNDGDRSKKYLELDVLNEASRNPTYYNIFGYEGIAEIYHLAKVAVEAADAETRLYTNEYNVLQYSNDPFSPAVQDPYANWYRRQVEGINNGGFGDVVSGIGVQYNVDPRTSNAQVHSPARVAQVMHNLSVSGLPITLTEFAIPPTTGGVTTTQERAAQIYNESLRLIFGTPQATSFLIWEAWPPATTDNTTLVDASWNLTQAGHALEDLLDAWTTELEDLVVGPDGTIDFTGFYGDYEITINGEKFDLSLTKGDKLYSLAVSPGDYNADGIVDGLDYAVWRNCMESNDLRADGNGDEMVTELDFDVWKLSYGTVYAPGGGQLSGAVPEPATVLLLACGLAVIAARRRGYRLSTR